MVKRSSILTSLDTPNTSNEPLTTVKAPKTYKGVRMRSWGSWVSEIRAPNQKTRIWLGSYSSAEAAARAYDAALLCLKGSSASLNFPNSPPVYNPPSTMSPKSIQRFAAAAANATAEESLSMTTPPPEIPSSVSSSSTDTITGLVEEESMESWVGDFGAFESPTCMDQMLINHWAVFDATQGADCDDYVFDLSLWSF